jgi:uncharacterized repeat protein (TIGR01451 family)
MKIKLLISSLIMAGAVSVASAGKFDQPSRGILSSNFSLNSTDDVSSTPDSSVTIDFSVLVGESWDDAGDADNMIANCVLGGSVTGVEWTNVTVETVGASWLSEATLSMTDSAGGQGISLNVGNGDDAAGIATYSSGAIIDFTDNALPDIVALGDGLLPIEIFEGFDDNADAIDANFTGGTVDIWGIGLTVNPNCPFLAVSDADLSISVSNNASGPLSTGSNVTFTQSVTNNGPGDANNTVVNGALSAGLIYVSDTCGAGSNLVWNIGTLANGASQSCDVVATVEGFGSMSYSASASADEADTVATNNNGNSGVNGPARIIPTLSQYGLFLMLFALIFVARRKIAK